MLFYFKLLFILFLCQLENLTDFYLFSLNLIQDIKEASPNPVARGIWEDQEHRVGRNGGGDSLTSPGPAVGQKDAPLNPGMESIWRRL